MPSSVGKHHPRSVGCQALGGKGERLGRVCVSGHVKC